MRSVRAQNAVVLLVVAGLFADILVSKVIGEGSAEMTRLVAFLIMLCSAGYAYLTRPGSR